MATLFDPVEFVNPAGRGDVLFLCDHASNALPPEYGDLGVAAADRARHIAWDVGARGVTLELARLFDAPAILTRFSRLLIDPNRGEDDPTLVMQLYDRTIIPGNRGISAAEVEHRLATYYRPYHQTIRAHLDRMSAKGITPRIIAIHSFTPQLRGRAPRPWHIGLLWDRDDRLLRPLMAALTRDPSLCIGDNEPYSGALKGDTMWQHGVERGLPHVLIELRNDLITDVAGQKHWAALLAEALRDVLGG